MIENGVLRGYLQDKLNARLMGVKPTGNGRRESFAHMTLPRMTNTYMLAGKHDPRRSFLGEEGAVLQEFGGGQVDITSGKFVFSASEAYLIEDGRLTTGTWSDADRQWTRCVATRFDGRQRLEVG